MTRTESSLPTTEWMPLLVDTGPLYALADASDAWHARTLAFLESADEILLLPVTVLPEVAHLIRSRLGPAAERVFFEAVARREVVVEPLSAEDLARTAELVAEYPELGFVDCSVVAVAERLRLPSLLTTDRRDFARVRPRHVETLQLLP